ncbi:30S ribosomal protein S6 [Campylobacter canadensis]|uniref:Small ribosomal subunit protein bS6 n=1 Tax=Campylobacter canadensis TaxID=449520 RepID=A0ABS7WPK0_9BACT|nr:30S ribosomal protein S6 [Campylobacter canadensis]MBZ7986701.1 30S ribosomal protein S6 [Campylobacter canadensis]MBZ7994605.1 30S ribosomal protein S6 [Campylobacter canadensis]MBZ7996835.1 30S ribosomal protein S6 [Campylobacter canadensis]MBZ7997737.1 30S ribosomal protein S6 [Campylobacter canadensis]MBZ7999936.1 30S ribosomal protein S6 [Campylobacter canadensis]
MKHYEVLFILKPTLTDEEVAARVEFVKQTLEKNGAKIAHTMTMGTRKLAYKIDKYERGTYYVIYFEAPTTLIAELERVLRITEDIIRFLIVKYENKREVSAWEKLVKGEKPGKKFKERAEKSDKGEKAKAAAQKEEDSE